MNLEVIQKDIMILKERYDSLHEMVLENIHKNERSYIELDMKIEKSLGDIKHDVNGIKTSLSSTQDLLRRLKKIQRTFRN
jgi:hypothetical protein